MTDLGRASARVAGELARLGLKAEVLELPDSTRTAAEAAATLGCDVAQIVKSIVFRLAGSDEALVVLASGVNRVDESKLAALAGGAVEQASGRFVREQTGVAIGGVPPVGHDRALRTWFDEDLLRYDVVWAAAGTPRSVFSARPAELARASGATVADVAGRDAAS